jgi:hypothetical protein
MIKGILVGVAVGFAAWKLGMTSGFLAFGGYGLVGALVGIICGKPLWRQETIWTPVLKGIFGFLFGIGFFWLARKVLGETRLPFATGLGAPDQPLIQIPFLVGPLIGMIYGIFVEVDDSTGKEARASAPAAGEKR